MPSVSCPNCDELVRLPATCLPTGSLVKCPCCDVVLPADQWLDALPPLAIVIAPGAMEPEQEGDEDDLDEAPSHSRISVAGSSVEQPSIDVIEQAWESPAAWESEESISDDDEDDDFDNSDNLGVDAEAFDEHDEFAQAELRDISGESQSRKKVPLAVDQRSFYQRHDWGRRPRNAVQWLKVASPTLVALPIIGLILYFSGIDLGFYPFNRSADASLADVRLKSHSQDGDEMATNADSPVGRVLVDSNQESSSAREGVNDVDALLGDRDATESTAATDDEDADLSPSEIVAELFSPDRESVEQEVPDVDVVIQNLKEKAKEIAAESQSEFGDPPGVTIAMRARQQWIERNQEPEQSAVDQEIALLNSATLAFPDEPPAVDVIAQASAESEQETELSVQTEPAEQTKISAIPEPEAPELPTFAAPEIDTPDMIAACELAIELIKGIKAKQPNEEPSRQSILATLLAYRSVSQLGSMELSANSPSVTKVFDELMHPDALTKMEPLCSEWIGWGRRKTDGMLLIGRLRQREDERLLELADGTQFRVQLSPAIELPNESRCAAIGKIISTEDVPLVQLVAGVVVP